MGLQKQQCSACRRLEPGKEGTGHFQKAPPFPPWPSSPCGQLALSPKQPHGACWQGGACPGIRTQLDRPVGAQQDVAAFEVSVDDLAAMKEMQSLQALREKEGRQG